MHYVGAVRFGAAGAKTSLRAPGKHVAVESDFAAEPGKPHRVTFVNASGRLDLAVDGRTVLSCEHALPEEHDQAVSSGASLSVEKAQADFSRVRLYRSIYYRPPEVDQRFGVDASPRTGA